MRKKIVQTIAIVCIGVGLFYLIKSYRAHFWFITMLFDDRYVPRNIPIGHLLLPNFISLTADTAGVFYSYNLKEYLVSVRL